MIIEIVHRGKRVETMIVQCHRRVDWISDRPDDARSDDGIDDVTASRRSEAATYGIYLNYDGRLLGS